MVQFSCIVMLIVCHLSSSPCRSRWDRPFRFCDGYFIWYVLPSPFFHPLVSCLPSLSALPLPPSDPARARFHSLGPFALSEESKDKNMKTLRPAMSKPQAQRSFSAGATQMLARESAEEGFVLISSDSSSAPGGASKRTCSLSSPPREKKNLTIEVIMQK